MGLPYSRNIDLLTGTEPGEKSAGVAVDTTGPVVDVSQRQLKSIQFECSGRASGSGAFTISVSNDGTNFVAYNRLIPNLTGTNSQTDAYVAAPTLNANGTSIYFFPVGDYFRYIQAAVDVTTDGTYKAILEAAG